MTDRLQSIDSDDQPSSVVVSLVPPPQTDAFIGDVDYTFTDLNRELFGNISYQFYWEFQSAIDEILQEAYEIQHQESEPVTITAILTNEFGINGVNGLYADKIPKIIEEPVGVDTKDTSLRFHQLMETSQKVGTGHANWGFNSGLEDLIRGPLKVLERSETTPTIAVWMDDSFFDKNSDQRKKYLKYVAALSRGCNVQIITDSVRTQETLIMKHAEEMPVSVSRVENPHQILPALKDETSSNVEESLRNIPRYGGHWAILEQAIAKGGEVSYDVLYQVEKIPGGKSRTRQLVGDLVEYDLVERAQAGTQSRIRLRRDGRVALAIHYFEDGRDKEYRGVLSQIDRDLNEASTEIRATPNSSGDNRVYKNNDREDNKEGRHSGNVDVREISYSDVAAAISASPNQGIGIADYGIDSLDDFRVPLWGYNEREECLVVGAEFKSPLQYGVCLARALAHDYTWEKVITPSKITNKVDLEKDGARRCLGQFNDERASIDDIISEIRDERDQIIGLTALLKPDSKNEDERELRSEILRRAHGLIGKVTHLLDLCDTEIVREVRLPEYSKNRHTDGDGNRGRQELLRFLQTAIPIGSRLHGRPAYRVLYESRQQKRRELPEKSNYDSSSSEDAVIGSWVLVGDRVSKITPYLRDALTNPNELQRGKRGFVSSTIQCPIVSGWQIENLEKAVKLVCVEKRRVPTRDAISLLAALTSSVYSVSKIVSDCEESHSWKPMDVEHLERLLGETSSERVLPYTSGSTKSNVMETLLSRDSPVRQTELCELAGVSTQSFRDNREPLLASNLVTEASNGYTTQISRGQVPSVSFSLSSGGERDLDFHVTESESTMEVAESALIARLVHPFSDEQLVRYDPAEKSLKCPVNTCAVFGDRSQRSD